jgi:hypothetical protein
MATHAALIQAMQVDRDYFQRCRFSANELFIIVLSTNKVTDAIRSNEESSLIGDRGHVKISV